MLLADLHKTELHGILAGGREPQTITSLRSKGEIAHSTSLPAEGERFLYVIRNADARRSGLDIASLLRRSPSATAHAPSNVTLSDKLH